MVRRGPYAKGMVRRDAILDKALDVIAQQGMRGASIKGIADAVELSPAGLLHYFTSKEELFTQIVRKRDERDRIKVDESTTADEIHDAYLALIEHNAQVPGLVELFTRMAAESVDPTHPAHEYYLVRGEAIRAQLTAAARKLQEAGRLPTRISPDVLARLVQAVSDGLQLQWLLDPSIDMPALLVQFFDALEPCGDRAVVDDDGASSDTAGRA